MTSAAAQLEALDRLATGFDGDYTSGMGHHIGIDMDQVREFLRRKEERRRETVDVRFERARRDVGQIVERIVAELNPQRIYQWGSLLDRHQFTEMSDIDIALEGLQGPEEFFRALGIAIEGSGLPVDVVEMERIPEDVAERIRTKGRVVYERKDA